MMNNGINLQAIHGADLGVPKIADLQSRGRAAVQQRVFKLQVSMTHSLQGTHYGLVPAHHSTRARCSWAITYAATRV